MKAQILAGRAEPKLSSSSSGFTPPSPSSFAALVLVALASVALLPGCHSNPGEACSDSPGSCSDKASHLVCTKGKYVLETCKGPGGCNDDKALTCDNTKADVGDGCGHEGAHAAPTGARSSAVATVSSRSSGAAAAGAPSTRTTTPSACPRASWATRAA